MSTLILSLFLAQYTPQEAQAVFVEGNDAYYRGEFAAAQERYQKLIQAGLGGPDVLFNLGTAHLAAGELGPALLYLERANRISDDDDISANLAVARGRQVDKVIGEEAAVPFTVRLAEAIDDHLVGGAFLAIWWLGFVFLWITLRRNSQRIVYAFVTAVLLTVGATLGMALAIQRQVRATVNEAIVIPEMAKVREFPGETAKVSFEIHAGLKVRVVETSGRYVRVRLANALEGWTEKEAVVSL